MQIAQRPACRWRAQAPMQSIASAIADGVHDRGDKPSIPRPVATTAESAAKQSLNEGCGGLCGQTCVADAARSERHGREKRASKQDGSSQRSSGGQRPYAQPRVGVHGTQHMARSTAVLGQSLVLLVRAALIREVSGKHVSELCAPAIIDVGWREFLLCLQYIHRAAVVKERLVEIIFDINKAKAAGCFCDNSALMNVAP